MSEFVNEKEFRIFLDESDRERYYLISNTSIQLSGEYAKIITCSKSSQLPNAAINIPINSLNLTAKFFSDDNLDFDPLILNLPLRKPIWEMLNLENYTQRPYKKWYITDIEKIGVNTYEFTAVDKMTLLEDEESFGKLFTGEYLEAALNSLTNYSMNIQVYSYLDKVEINGYYKPSSIKKSLEELSLNYSLFMEFFNNEEYEEFLYVSNNDHPYPFSPDTTYSTFTFMPNKIMQIPSLQVLERPTEVRVTSHDFKVSAGGEATELFNGIVTPHQIQIGNNTYTGEIVKFDKPYRSITFTNGYRVTINNEGYVVFNCINAENPTIVTGYSYRDDTAVTIVGTNEGETKEINDIYSICPLTVEGISTNLLRYYDAMPNSSFDCWCKPDDIVIGNSVWVPTEKNFYSLNKIVSIERDLEPTAEWHTTITSTSDFQLYPPERAVLLDHIEITQTPTKTKYYLNDELDITGMVVTAYWEDDTSSVLDSSEYAVYPTILESLGTQTITVQYTKNTVTSTRTFTVQVIKKPVSLIIDTPPNTIIYYAGESVDYTGLTAHVVYEGSGIKRLTLDDLTVTPFVFPIDGEEQVYRLPVQYEDIDSSVTLTAYVDFYEVEIGNLVSISVIHQPTKTQYYVGERFNTSGMIVQAIFDSGIVRVITNYTYNTNPLTINDTSMTFSYTFDGTTKQWTVPIEVWRIEYSLMGDVITSLNTYGGLIAGFPLKAAIKAESYDFNGNLKETVSLLPQEVELIRNNQSIVTQWKYNFEDNRNVAYPNHSLSVNVTTRIDNQIFVSGTSYYSIGDYYSFIRMGDASLYNQNICILNNELAQASVRMYDYNNSSTRNPDCEFDMSSYVSQALSDISTYPDNTYQIYSSKSTNILTPYYPKMAFYCPELQEGTYTTDTDISIYIAMLQPNSNATVIPYSIIRNIDNYTLAQLASYNIEYLPCADFICKKDSSYYTVTNLDISSTYNNRPVSSVCSSSSDFFDSYDGLNYSSYSNHSIWRLQLSTITERTSLSSSCTFTYNDYYNTTRTYTTSLVLNSSHAQASTNENRVYRHGDPKPTTVEDSRVGFSGTGSTTTSDRYSMARTILPNSTFIAVPITVNTTIVPNIFSDYYNTNKRAVTIGSTTSTSYIYESDSAQEVPYINYPVTSTLAVNRQVLQPKVSVYTYENTIITSPTNRRITLKLFDGANTLTINSGYDKDYWYKIGGMDLYSSTADTTKENTDDFDIESYTFRGTSGTGNYFPDLQEKYGFTRDWLQTQYDETHIPAYAELRDAMYGGEGIARIELHRYEYKQYYSKHNTASIGIFPYYSNPTSVDYDVDLARNCSKINGAMTLIDARNPTINRYHTYQTFVFRTYTSREYRTTFQFNMYDTGELEEVATDVLSPYAVINRQNSSYTRQSNTNPTKTAYELGESLELAGASVIINGNIIDGNRLYADSTVTSMTTTGTKNFQLYYPTNSVNSFTITVSQPASTNSVSPLTVSTNTLKSAPLKKTIAIGKLEIITLPKTEYNVGEDFDIAGLEVSYNDEIIYDFNITIPDTSTIGEKEIVIEKDGATTTYSITVS